MIKVSDTAKKKVIELMTEDGFDASKDFVRVGVKRWLFRFIISTYF
jgi:iron-sulfur cluster assembly protein